MTDMILKTAADGAIASGAEHWIDEYESKIPSFMQASDKTLGNVTAMWRFNDSDSIEYDVRFRVKTETLALYEELIAYYANGTQFRLNETPDLNDLLLVMKATACTFGRLVKVRTPVVYAMNLTCILVTEDV